MRAFDPNFADVHLTTAFVDSMDVIKPLVGLGMLSELKQELHLYLAAVKNAPTFNKSSVEDYTKELLKWWRTNGSRFKAWARAARIVLALVSYTSENVSIKLCTSSGGENRCSMKIRSGVSAPLGSSGAWK